MGYASLLECVLDLEREGKLLRLDEEVCAELEAAEIQRRVFRAGGPAVFYTRVRGCRFPMVSNLFGTKERAHYIFRDSLAGVRALVGAKADPTSLLSDLSRAWKLPGSALHMLPRTVNTGPVLGRTARLSDLPRLVSWPDDGGPFVTLPQVYTEDPTAPGYMRSNLGMYRIQLAGNAYVPEHEVGLHYQLHRGIGVHHAEAIRRGTPLRVNVFVGGPPALTLAAVMPLPEGLPELFFAGALNGRALRMIRDGSGPAVHADADFCIRGYVVPNETKPEGPFGDHLGYYARLHEFPVLHVESVHCRKDAIWPFTVVGRPPQEDTVFGELIHELTGPLVPTVLPGVSAVHAVDAAGVHPLLLAIGSERYVPYARERRPMEVLTQAHAILGQGQMSLAKYLFVVAKEDAPELRVADVRSFFRHVLERFVPERDWHFVTNTTIDTLDYSGTALNQGSKVVVCAVGPVRRELAATVPSDLPLPEGFREPRICLPGVLALRAPGWQLPSARSDEAAGDETGTCLSDGVAARFCEAFAPYKGLRGLPLIVLVDDSEFVAQTLENFLWVTFTRSNPAVDVYGIRSFFEHKAWGCRGSVVIDARRKPHHAPPLVEDPDVTARVNALALRAGPLRRYL